MKKTFTLALLFFGYYIINAQNEAIDSVHVCTTCQQNISIINDTSKLGPTIRLSKHYRGQKILTAITGSGNTFSPVFSNNTWPQGAWFNGYYSTNDIKTFYVQDLTGAGRNGFWSSHPLYRYTSQQVRAMLHLHNSYQPSAIIHDNIGLIIDGLNYLIAQQGSDGGYVYWNVRSGQNIFNTDDSPGYINTDGTPGHNDTQVYETAHALVTMCEGYLYLKKINQLNLVSNLYAAIQKSANNILAMDPDAGDYSNSNYRGFGAWGLAKAYKVTGDCDYLARARAICQRLIDAQQTSGTLCKGTWQTGGHDGPNSSFNHDTEIGYHLIALKGLIETLDIVPPTMATFKTDLANTIKRGINHVIEYRLNQTDGTLLQWYEDFNCTDASASASYATYTYFDDGVEPFALLAYYARYHTDLFAESEIASLRHLSDIVSMFSGVRIDPATNGQGDVSALRQLNSLAYYIDYRNAINKQIKIFAEDSPPGQYYDPTKITNRVVVGDFDNDGKKDDIAAFYDYGINPATQSYETGIHVWKANNNMFEYSGAAGWWRTTGYNSNSITAVASGDFDHDGWQDDIAAFYDYGNGETRIHVWKAQGGEFVYVGPYGYWDTTGYDANKITGRLVSGDFDNDGWFDDLAAFYDYGNGETRIHVWESQGTNFTYVGPFGFWNTTGYNANNVTGRVVSGDFDNDGKLDDIAAFYDYGSNGQTFETRIHVWEGQQTSFYYLNANGMKVLTNYDASKITGRVVSGDFDGDAKNDDIAVYYDHGGNISSINTFLGTGSVFGDPLSVWSAAYDPSKVTGRVVSGDFMNDGKQNDISAFYDAGSGDTRLHTWTYYSPDQTLEYQGPGGWWVECAPDTYMLRAFTENEVTEITPEKVDTDGSFVVFPNPAIRAMTVRYQLSNPANVKLRLIDLLGNERIQLVNERQESGQYEITVDTQSLGEGMYFCDFETGYFKKAIRVLVRK